MEEILIKYYADNAKELRRLVDKIRFGFGGVSEKDADDFYSLANEVFADAMNRYDDSQSFESYLYSCLSNRIKSEISRRNRVKRKADRMSVSIDMLVGDDESATLGDMIADGFDMEKEILEGQEQGYSKRMRRYLGRLSSLQREVLELTTAGYRPDEIREKLHMTKKQYADCNAAIHSYRNISVLF